MSGEAAPIKLHPVCEVFPQMDEAALGELTADIRANGLRESIWRHKDGSIIDGRNRYIACTRARVAPKFRVYDKPDSTLPAFVVSLNYHRRNLDESQRAMVAAKMANLGKGERPADVTKSQKEIRKFADLTPAPPVTVPEAAKLLNVSERSVQSARVVQERGVKELQAAVEKGAFAVSSAAQVARLPEAVQRRAVEERVTTPKARLPKRPKRHEIHRGKQHLNVTKALQNLTNNLEGLVLGISGIDFTQADPEQIPELSGRIREALSSLRKTERSLTAIAERKQTA